MNPRVWIDALRTAFDNLSMREKVLVSSTGGALVLALLYAMVVIPALTASDNVEMRVVSAEQQRTAMLRLRREYDDVSHRLGSVEERIGRGSRGNLRTTLESLARKTNVKIESMEPQASPANDRYRETKVAVGLESVTLEQAVTLLHEIESHQQVLSVKTLRIRTRVDKPELLDLSFTVSSFEPV
ncbi:MAG: type II secretion system protein M [Myxococcales bacterium]|nr:type II secretion system protein M [Myxococcales bacterium]